MLLKEEPTLAPAVNSSVAFIAVEQCAQVVEDGEEVVRRNLGAEGRTNLLVRVQESKALILVERLTNLNCYCQGYVSHMSCYTRLFITYHLHVLDLGLPSPLQPIQALDNIVHDRGSVAALEIVKVATDEVIDTCASHREEVHLPKSSRAALQRRAVLLQRLFSNMRVGSFLVFLVRPTPVGSFSQPFSAFTACSFTMP